MLLVALCVLAGCRSNDALDHQESTARARTCMSLLERRIGTRLTHPDGSAPPDIDRLADVMEHDPERFYATTGARVRRGFDPGDSRPDTPGHSSNLGELLDVCRRAVG